MKRVRRKKSFNSKKKILIVCVVIAVIVITGILIYNYYKSKVLLAPADSTIQQAFGLPATTACNMFAKSIMDLRSYYTMYGYQDYLRLKYVTPGVYDVEGKVIPDGNVYCQALASTGISGYVLNPAGSYYILGSNYIKVYEPPNKCVLPNAILFNGEECTTAGCQMKPCTSVCGSTGECKSTTGTCIAIDKILLPPSMDYLIMKSYNGRSCGTCKTCSNGECVNVPKGTTNPVCDSITSLCKTGKCDGNGKCEVAASDSRCSYVCSICKAINGEPTCTIKVDGDEGFCVQTSLGIDACTTSEDMRTPFLNGCISNGKYKIKYTCKDGKKVYEDILPGSCFVF